MESEFFDALSKPEPSLRNIIERTTLKWVFIGGKGGVGKTTVCCSLAIQLAQVRESVLIISTDPAHNLSDAFSQKFTRTPSLVNTFSNLYAMETDPKTGVRFATEEEFDERVERNFWRDLYNDVATAVPGVDEAVSFAEVLKLINKMEFSIIVFDTAPTGHTLRLLSFPQTFEKSLEKIIRYKCRLTPLVNQVNMLFGGPPNLVEDLSNMLEDITQSIKELNRQFVNPELTTFICVCIPEFLSLYETERLIQQLYNLNMDTHNLVVNQLLTSSSNCDLCSTRAQMQKKYLNQIQDLYEDFHITELPLLNEEVRGCEKLKAFSAELMKGGTSFLN